MFLYIEKNIFLFLICHCTKRATDNKMNPQVEKDKQMRKKKLHNSFHIDKQKSRLWRVVDCWKNWGLLLPSVPTDWITAGVVSH